MPKNGIQPTDKHVGQRVRKRRLILGMSQKELANALVSLIDCYVVQLSQVFMLRVFPFGTNY